MGNRVETICWSCNKLRERCKAVQTSPNGEVEYCCPRCWRELDMDRYLYKHKKVE